MHTARMEIEFDPEKAASNLRKHRVSFAHAEQALRDPLGITIEDPGSEGESRFVTLGADSLGSNSSRSPHTAKRSSPNHLRA